MPAFLFTDIEGSTPLWENHREAMLAALLDHNRILEEQITLHFGSFLPLGKITRSVYGYCVDITIILWAIHQRSI
jgi:class 3 adenylate cyclase